MHRRPFLKAIAAIPLAFSRLVSAVELPRTAGIPGGVAILELGSGPAPPKVRFLNEQVLVTGDTAGWKAVVGLPLDLKPGNSRLLYVMRGKGDPDLLTVAVGRANYSTQHLTVKPGQVELTPEDLLRYEREVAHLSRMRRTFSESAPPSLSLLQPCDGPRFNTFGRRRFFNGKPRRPHNGMDIAAPTGTPILAAGAGKVIDVGDYLFSGRTIILDHGQGFLTLYAHLSEVDIGLNAEVQAGTQIGKVGTTGRVTGPHVHFSVYLNAAAVDPGLFLPDTEPATQ